jgi:hypothetical protein
MLIGSRDTAAALMLVVALAFVVLQLTSKRSEVAWSTFFLRGPLLMLSPEQYFETNRVRWIKFFGWATVGFGVATWALSWAVDNA